MARPSRTYGSQRKTPAENDNATSDGPSSHSWLAREAPRCLAGPLLACIMWGGAAADPQRQIQHTSLTPRLCGSSGPARQGVLTRLSSSMHRGQLPALQPPHSPLSALPVAASASVSGREPSARPQGTTSMPMDGRDAFTPAPHSTAPSSSFSAAAAGSAVFRAPLGREKCLLRDGVAAEEKRRFG